MSRCTMPMSMPSSEPVNNVGPELHWPPNLSSVPQETLTRPPESPKLPPKARGVASRHDEVSPPAVASIAHQIEGHARGKPDEILSALDAGDINRNLLQCVHRGPVLLVAIFVGTDIGPIGLGSREQQRRVGGEALQQMQTAGREPEDCDLRVLGHSLEILGDCLQGAHGRNDVQMQGVDQDNVDWAGGWSYLDVGIDR